MSVWLRIAGYPATEIAAHTPPTWETWADGGTGSISWAFALSLRSQHQALRPGSVVEVMVGCVPVATGILMYPDRTTWECTAYGIAADAKNYLALDGGGNATRDIAVAIENAQVAGWKGSDQTGYSGVASGDSTGNPVTLGQLLDEYAQQVGRRWGVTGRRKIYLDTDPTAPKWLASPGASAFGTTSEDRANTLKGRFLNSSTGLYATATAGAGTPQAAVDLTPRGAMSAAEAQAALEGMLALNQAQQAWTNGVVLTRDQLQTVGGTPAFLPSVQAGHMASAFGIAYAADGFRLDTVIGKTRYTAGEDTIYIEPVNTAPSDVSSVLAA